MIIPEKKDEILITTTIMITITIIMIIVLTKIVNF